MNDRFADLAWQNECTGWLQVGRVESAGNLYQLDQAEGIVCGWNSQIGGKENFLMIPPGFNGDLGKALENLKPRIKSAKSGTVFRYIAEREKPDWRKILAGFDFMYLDSSLLMSCDLENISINLNPLEDETVKMVESEGEYRQVVQLIGRTFGGSEELASFFCPTSLTSVFAVWVGKRPVSAAVLWPFAGAAGIYSVCTDRHFQRKGYAQLVLGYLLLFARQSGFSHAVLRTTDNLVSLYAYFGFIKSGRVARWIHFWQD